MNIHNINICDTNLRFEFIVSVPSHVLSEVKGYVTEFECKVLYYIEDYLNDEDEKVIGKLSGYRFPLYDCYWNFDEENNDYIHALDLFDMINDEVARLICLFNKNGRIKPQYLKLIPELDYGLPNIILIKRVEILADYRGKKVGESLISKSIYTIGKNNDLVIVDPAPLQFLGQSQENNEWNQEMKFTEFKSNNKIARKKLNNYYKKLGFQPLADKLMFLIYLQP